MLIIVTGDDNRPRHDRRSNWSLSQASRLDLQTLATPWRSKAAISTSSLTFTSNKHHAEYHLHSLFSLCNTIATSHSFEEPLSIFYSSTNLPDSNNTHHQTHLKQTLHTRHHVRKGLHHLRCLRRCCARRCRCSSGMPSRRCQVRCAMHP